MSLCVSTAQAHTKCGPGNNKAPACSTIVPLDFHTKWLLSMCCSTALARTKCASRSWDRFSSSVLSCVCVLSMCSHICALTYVLSHVCSHMCAPPVLEFMCSHMCALVHVSMCSDMCALIGVLCVLSYVCSPLCSHMCALLFVLS